MLTQFGATADSLSKASTMVFRFGTDAHLYDDPDDVSIAPLLDSKFDSDKCEALKRLLALIAQGFDVSNYFPQVVKNVASQSLEVKKLVYVYLLHYAEKRPNEALLSINYFQKDLGDPNPLVRAWALRTMAGIRLHTIAPLALMAVGKCARDPTVYVRKCAATALLKLHDLRLEEHTSAIEEIVGILLKDNSPSVIGSAAGAFAAICPNNFSLIGKYIRKLCEILPDVEEWGQIVLVGILLRYVIAKHGLVEGSLLDPLRASVKNDLQNEDLEPNLAMKNHLGNSSLDICPEIVDIVRRSYLEGPDKYLSQLGHIKRDSLTLDPSHVVSPKNNDDVRLLLQCTSPLLWSYNSAVVLAASGVHWIMAPKDDVVKIVKPLLFLLRSSGSSKYVVLCNIQVFSRAMPSLFSPYFEDFFISSSDAYQIKTLKLEILSSIATYSSVSSIFLEFQDYIRDPDRSFAADVVAAIGLCAQQLPDVANTCLEALMVLALSESSNNNLASSGEEIVLIQAIKSIKAIIKHDPPSHENVIVHLVRSLDSIKAAAARAMVIWMLGEYNDIGNLIPKMIPILFMYLARCFTSEAVETKLQIINASIKVLLHAKGEDISQLNKAVGYLLELAKCDPSYDVRDRGCVLKNLQTQCVGTQALEEVKDQKEFRDLKHVLAEHIFGRKTKVLSEPFSYRFYLPGSLSQIVLHAAPGYEPLPEPCSLVDDETIESPNHIQRTKSSGISSFDSEHNGIDNSESLEEEDTSGYSSNGSVTASDDGYDSALVSDANGETDSLIHLSDGASASRNQIPGSEHNNSSELNDFGDLMSKKAFESWLDENPGPSYDTSDVGQVQRSLAIISIKDMSQLIKPKSYKLVDPSNDNGLSANYTFLPEVSSISPQLICLQVSFNNCSNECISNIYLTEDEPDKGSDSLEKSESSSERSFSESHGEISAMAPMEEICSLDPGHAVTRTLHVRFGHHLLPLKLVLWCNGRRQLVKLRPEIGYFVKPLPMDIEAFTNKESQLPGMFEYTRRCTFVDHIGDLNDKSDHLQAKDNFLIICEKLALKMLSNANLFLVSVEMPVASNLNEVSGLCLRFSGEILSSLCPCLIKLTLEGNCYAPLDVLVKINCEETVFALNLLNRVVNFFAEPSHP